MKCHKYTMQVYESAGDMIHCDSQTQYFLYFPQRGVLAYRPSGADYLDNNKTAIERAERIIRGDEVTERQAEGKYLGECELPDELAFEVIGAGLSLNRERANFEVNVRELLKILGG